VNFRTPPLNTAVTFSLSPHHLSSKEKKDGTVVEKEWKSDNADDDRVKRMREIV
jgi:hypothetical protein